jgi:hypothetical protein
MKTEEEKKTTTTLPQLLPFSRENSPILETSSSQDSQLTLNNINKLNNTTNSIEKPTTSSSLGHSFGSSLPSFNTLDSFGSSLSDNQSPNNQSPNNNK